MRNSELFCNETFVRRAHTRLRVCVHGARARVRARVGCWPISLTARGVVVRSADVQTYYFPNFTREQSVSFLTGK